MSLSGVSLWCHSLVLKRDPAIVQFMTSDGRHCDIIIIIMIINIIQRGGIVTGVTISAGLWCDRFQVSDLEIWKYTRFYNYPTEVHSMSNVFRLSMVEREDLSPILRVTHFDNLFSMEPGIDLQNVES